MIVFSSKVNVSSQRWKFKSFKDASFIIVTTKCSEDSMYKLFGNMVFHTNKECRIRENFVVNFNRAGQLEDFLSHKPIQVE